MSFYIMVTVKRKDILKINYIIVGNIEKRLVFYLGFESHPQHELAKKQMSGFGGMITFFINGNLETAKKFFKNTKVRF